MRYHSRLHTLDKTKKMIFIGMLVAMALVLSYFERFIPVIAFPGVKLGLANIITLTALYFLTFGEAILLVSLRIILNSFFIGSLVTFWYSLSGGILSLVVMYLLVKYAGEKLSKIGISIVGAVCHNIGQLVIVAIITENIGVALGYFPILLISGVITGVLIGLVVNHLLPYLKKIFNGNIR